jgi:hypothetical protein
MAQSLTGLHLGMVAPVLVPEKDLRREIVGSPLTVGGFRGYTTRSELLGSRGRQDRGTVTPYMSLPKIYFHFRIFMASNYSGMYPLK